MASAKRMTRRPLRKRAFFRRRGQPMIRRRDSEYSLPILNMPAGEPVYSAHDLGAAIAAALAATLGFHRFKRTG